MTHLDQRLLSFGKGGNDGIKILCGVRTATKKVGKIRLAKLDFLQQKCNRGILCDENQLLIGDILIVQIVFLGEGIVAQKLCTDRSKSSGEGYGIVIICQVGEGITDFIHLSNRGGQRIFILAGNAHGQQRDQVANDQGIALQQHLHHLVIIGHVQEEVTHEQIGLGAICGLDILVVVHLAVGKLCHGIASFVEGLKLGSDLAKLLDLGNVLSTACFQLLFIAGNAEAAIHVHDTQVGDGILYIIGSLVDQVNAIVKHIVSLGVEILLKKLPIGAGNGGFGSLDGVFINQRHLGQEYFVACRLRRHGDHGKQHCDGEKHTGNSFHNSVSFHILLGFHLLFLFDSPHNKGNIGGNRQQHTDDLIVRLHQHIVDAVISDGSG